MRMELHQNMREWNLPVSDTGRQFRECGHCAKSKIGVILWLETHYVFNVGSNVYAVSYICLIHIIVWLNRNRAEDRKCEGTSPTPVFLSAEIINVWTLKIGRKSSINGPFFGIWEPANTFNKASIVRFGFGENVFRATACCPSCLIIAKSDAELY